VSRSWKTSAGQLLAETSLSTSGPGMFAGLVRLADHTYGVFLPKHRRGNPGGYTEHFLQNPDGSYSLIR
jgi:hypothetical protein